MSDVNKNIKNSQNDGFTLLELVVIIVIISIISIVTYPRFANIVQSVKLKVATDKLVDDLRYIYNFSVTNHRTTWFAVDVGSNSYSYGIYNTPPNSDPVVLNDPATNLQAIINLNNYNNVTITNITFVDSVDYDWWGTPSTGGQIILNGTNTIVIEAETGYVYEL